MKVRRSPYDTLPYESRPIEWTAPERLAIASLLHGGPRVDLRSYRYLELGCGNGANLIPLAYYRRHAQFVGVDSASTACQQAMARADALGLDNLKFIHADFGDAVRELDGEYDVILGHGVFSWVTDTVRDELLDVCERYLAPSGLLCLSYNTRPGWDVRGLLRDFLRTLTAEVQGLPARSELAQQVATRLASILAPVEHPYSQLLASELGLIRDAHHSYVGHEYLAEHNRAYWRREFLQLLSERGFAHVADADFNYSSGRLPEGLESRVPELGLSSVSQQDALDLLCFRQFHCPVLTHSTWTSKPMQDAELASLYVASRMLPSESGAKGRFRHPSGYEVEAAEDPMCSALVHLHEVWPRGERVEALFSDLGVVREDLLLLQLNGLVELRSVEPADFGVEPGALHRLEAPHGYHTTPHHTLCDGPASGL